MNCATKAILFFLVGTVASISGRQGHAQTSQPPNGTLPAATNSDSSAPTQGGRPSSTGASMWGAGKSTFGQMHQEDGMWRDSITGGTAGGTSQGQFLPLRRSAAAAMMSRQNSIARGQFSWSAQQPDMEPRPQQDRVLRDQSTGGANAVAEAQSSWGLRKTASPRAAVSSLSSMQPQTTKRTGTLPSNLSFNQSLPSRPVAEGHAKGRTPGRGHNSLKGFDAGSRLGYLSDGSGSSRFDDGRSRFGLNPDLPTHHLSSHRPRGTIDSGTKLGIRKFEQGSGAKSTGSKPN